MFKKGDKVLIEGVISERYGAAWQVEAGGFDARVYTEEEIRPWTEKPPEPVRALWTTSNGNYQVMSDGSVEWNGSLGPRQFDSPPRKLEVLAEYVRSNSR